MFTFKLTHRYQAIRVGRWFSTWFSMMFSRWFDMFVSLFHILKSMIEQLMCTLFELLLFAQDDDSSTLQVRKPSHFLSQCFCWRTVHAITVPYIFSFRDFLLGCGMVSSFGAVIERETKNFSCYVIPVVKQCGKMAMIWASFPGQRNWAPCSPRVDHENGFTPRYFGFRACPCSDLIRGRDRDRVDILRSSIEYKR